VRDALDPGLLTVGRLDGAAATLPGVDHLLLYTYQRKEVVLSSQIAGMQLFATAIRVSATSATEFSRRVFAVFRVDRDRSKGIGRLALTGLLIQEALQARPLGTIAALTAAAGLTPPPATQALLELEKLGIVRETTGKARGRAFAYARYLNALNEG
jgi:Fic family protein